MIQVLFTFYRAMFSSGIIQLNGVMRIDANFKALTMFWTQVVPSLWYFKNAFSRNDAFSYFLKKKKKKTFKFSTVI